MGTFSLSSAKALLLFGSCLSLTPSALVAGMDIEGNSISLQDSVGQLSASGSECASSARVECTIGTLTQFYDPNHPNIPCEDNLRLPAATCDVSGAQVERDLVITYEYCNEEEILNAKPIRTRTFENFLSVKKDTIYVENLAPGECKTVHVEEKVDLCENTKAVTMDVKYEGKLPGRASAYCYAYRFLRVYKTYLVEDVEDAKCAGVTADLSCTIDGEPCSGNIVKKYNSDESCIDEDITVTWSYQHCFWNTEGSLRYLNASNDKKSKIKRDRVIYPIANKSIHESGELCRIQTEEVVVNTCNEKRIASSLYIEGRLEPGSTPCTAYAFHEVERATVCDEDFIITQIFDPRNDPNHRFVTIKTGTCSGNIVTDDISIVKFVRGIPRPNQAGPISLKGRKIPSDGFFVFCATDAGAEFYGDGFCDEVTLPGSASDVDGRDQIAIIRGSVAGSYEILDIFGVVGENGEGTDHDFQNSLATRRLSATTPNEGDWDVNNWDINTADSDDDNVDFRTWGSMPYASPTSAPTPKPSSKPSAIPSSAPSMAPSSAPSMAPSSTPSSAPSMTPSSTPSMTPSSTPSMAPSMTPSSTPSMAPSSSPSMTPSSTPSSSPSMAPSATPSEAPSSTTNPPSLEPTIFVAPCVYDFVLSEIAGPSGYVEIYSDNCKGETMTQDILIEIWNEDSTTASSGKINLNGLTIPADGVLLFCSSSYSGSANCDSISGDDTAANSDGDDQIAITLFNNILDLFGVIGEDGSGTDHDFGGGVAQRKPFALTPTASWNPEDWDIFPGIGPCCIPIPYTPGLPPCEDFILTELIDPADNSFKTYIEIYTYNMGGKTITEDYALVRYNEDGIPVDQVHLMGLAVPSDGFLVFCKEGSIPTFDAGECDYEHTIANFFGIEGSTFKITRDDCAHDCICSDFTDGRAVRKTHEVGASPECNPNIWNIYQPADSDEGTPHNWTDDCPSAEPSSKPSSSPSATPSKDPSASPSATPSKDPSASPSAMPSDTPSAMPSATPSAAPSKDPSAAPSTMPSATPSATPSKDPSAAPSATPSKDPSASPSATPSKDPSASPSTMPSDTPSAMPSSAPSAAPSKDPSAAPSTMPSATPSATPSKDPSAAPSATPSKDPSAAPSTIPSATPSVLPSKTPSVEPTKTPSTLPSFIPSVLPSNIPSVAPSSSPSKTPSKTPSTLPSFSPSVLPSNIPTILPTKIPSVVPSKAPSKMPSREPSEAPSTDPSSSPSDLPSETPSSYPTCPLPTALPSTDPSKEPSDKPSKHPSSSPSGVPSVRPSLRPSSRPSAAPSNVPSASPSSTPSSIPSSSPSKIPSVTPSTMPSAAPSSSPSKIPSVTPSTMPSAAPSAMPSAAPSSSPSAMPSVTPSAMPSAAPSSSPSKTPSVTPSTMPSAAPSSSPSAMPSVTPSTMPSVTPSTMPSAAPSSSPSTMPSVTPSAMPSVEPSASPSKTPSVTPSAMPSTSPSSSPSKTPSVDPSSTPSSSPSSMPSSEPSLVPSPGVPTCEDIVTTQAPTCDYDVLITEIVDTSDNPDGRYIELHANKECAYSSTLHRPLYLAFYDCDTDDETQLSPYHIPLEGAIFDENGFIVICGSSNGDDVHEPYRGPGACNYHYGVSAGPAYGDGRDRYVLKEGTFPGGIVVDAYGSPNPPVLTCAAEGRCFTDGRVSRKSNVQYPNASFDINQWIINNNVPVSDPFLDPGKRVDNSSPPTPAPVPSGKGAPSPTHVPTAYSKGATPTNPPTTFTKGGPNPTNPPTNAKGGPSPTNPPTNAKGGPSPTDPPTNTKGGPSTTAPPTDYSKGGPLPTNPPTNSKGATAPPTPSTKGSPSSPTAAPTVTAKGGPAP